MAKLERDGSPKGKSISIALEKGGGTIEIIEGSMKSLGIKSGDLILVRLASDRYREHAIYRQVQEVIERMLVNTGRKAVALIVPADFDLEVLPNSVAVPLLEKLVEKQS